MLRRTFAVDVFSCPRCAGPRRVLASLTQGAVIRRILRHLQRPEQPPRLAPALGPPQQALWESLSAEGLPPLEQLAATGRPRKAGVRLESLKTRR